MTLPLTVAERKHLLPHGKSKEIAHEEGVSRAYVSGVLGATIIPRTPEGWRTYRRVAVRIARALRRPLLEAFPELEKKAERPLVADSVSA